MSVIGLLVMMFCRDARKLVIRVSDKVRVKPASSATETIKKIEISLVTSLDMILSKNKLQRP